MPRPLSPEIRRSLIEKAARMLARREEVTARSLATACGTSTTALYTYFGGMDGLWRAVRQEGFVRLGARLAKVTLSKDPIRDLAAYGVAYVDNAQRHPDLYRVMFDASFALEDAAQAAAGFAVLPAAAARAKEAGRLAPSTDPQVVATRLWAMGHGLCSLVGSGVLAEGALATHAPAMQVALFVDAGDDPARCRRSVALAWRTP